MKILLRIFVLETARDAEEVVEAARTACYPMFLHNGMVYAVPSFGSKWDELKLFKLKDLLD